MLHRASISRKHCERPPWVHTYFLQEGEKAFLLNMWKNFKNIKHFIALMTASSRYNYWNGYDIDPYPHCIIYTLAGVPVAYNVYGF